MSSRTAVLSMGTHSAFRQRPCASRAILVRVARPVRESAKEPTGIYGAAAMLSLLCADPAGAVGGQFGILEGRSIALIHPVVMAGLFGSTLYTGWLGWQWRETRTIGAQIKDLKARLPAADADGNLPLSPIATEVEELEQKRKMLVNGKFKDRHFNMGSILLAGGVVIAIEGCLNTWSRTGKLFPGPHLFAGASIVALWALAASLVPAMQKGNDSARNAHIALNAANVALFVWQIPTGWDIVLKVFKFTSWP
eukprot:jgi/Ulvmu1/4194/UM019_0173.1